MIAAIVIAAGSVINEPIRGTKDRLIKNITVFCERGVILETRSDRKLIAKLAKVKIGFEAATTITAKTNKAST